MLGRRVVVFHEAIRLWCLKFGEAYAHCLRHLLRRPGDAWFLDEAFCKINGTIVYLWRAVDQDGDIHPDGWHESWADIQRVGGSEQGSAFACTPKLPDSDARNTNSFSMSPKSMVCALNVLLLALHN